MESEKDEEKTGRSLLFLNEVGENIRRGAALEIQDLHFSACLFLAGCHVQSEKSPRSMKFMKLPSDGSAL